MQHDHDFRWALAGYEDTASTGTRDACPEHREEHSRGLESYAEIGSRRRGLDVESGREESPCYYALFYTLAGTGMR
ncbi:MAG: hypothetical protein M3Z35_00110 [Nitrospirota bacterium]|nr:hypothetical protein [Nitrospirota bacterium]